MEAATDFTFLGSMITADGDSSYEIKRRLLLGKKSMTSLDSTLKSRDITLPTRWLDSVIEATNMNLTQLTEAVEERRAWHALVHGVTKGQTRLND